MSASQSSGVTANDGGAKAASRISSKITSANALRRMAKFSFESVFLPGRDAGIRIYYTTSGAVLYSIM